MKDFIEGFSLYNTVIISISLLLLIGTFWTNYGVWAPMFDYMHIMMAVFLINVNLPPTPMYALGVFKYSLFTFLPNFFTSLFPTPFFDPKIMNNSAFSMLKDFSFLRNMGQLYFLLVILICFLLVVFGMSKKFFNKKIKTWAKQFIR